ncbi:hypothetical protein FJ970_12865 [Mesorhizobium sp. B2-1-8]|uniref:hypothetical protein n=1 Tax=Mesorhizobium sp. B2-1-8 TaxID=2589967 RepID=UPI001D1306AD|nr:hypothetical protein [Mesorhizobium sp. B2-1-8]UCI21784.1 hypothetical protein FJ970_12865 [Mesorhizobium sp. B2-1-8]
MPGSALPADTELAIMLAEGCVSDACDHGIRFRLHPLPHATGSADQDTQQDHHHQRSARAASGTIEQAETIEIARRPSWQGTITRHKGCVRRFEKMQGTTMRMLMIVAALSGVVVTQPLYGQAVNPQVPQTPVPQMTPLEPQPDQIPLPGQGTADQNFTDVAVVAVEDLPAEIKAQAEAVITQTSAEDLLRLQNSIDASPQATTALRANGLNSSQVVAANIDGDGTLTLIIQTTT